MSLEETDEISGVLEEEGEEAESSDEEHENEDEGEVHSGTYNAKEVNDQVFEELQLPPETASEVQEVWRHYMATAESREAAGEAIYAALFDAAPSLQSLFKTPRAVMAMRFMNGLNQMITAVNDPKALKIIVETLGFQHLDLEVTIPRVIIFRDAITELISVEVGSRVTPRAADGLATFLNYVGGSYIYVRVKYSERIKVLGASWAMVTKRASEEDGEEEEEQDDGGDAEPEQAPPEKEAMKKKTRSMGSSLFSSKQKSKGDDANNKTSSQMARETSDFRNTAVPKTYEDMFMFNAAVMGFGNHGWMSEVLASFDTIVTNVSNSYRLQEECDVLSLRMAKYRGTINFGEYKAVMLASLRSLVKGWGSQHEIAWSWLWENVERMLKGIAGKPAQQEKALTTLFASLGEAELGIVRREVYSKFFATAPAGQDYFKQSTTRLHFIADKVVAMTLDMYKEPKKMVEDISALGLRHVGYGIPTELFGPFVTATVQVVRTLTDNDAAEEAFRWSLSLISRILTRVINEGSTIVMKAINANSSKQVKKAVGWAPRGKRALWMLNVQVGTQSISPLMWAIETGSLEAAKAIILDLLTIRADRDRYYYGVDILFERHPDIVKRLCVDAPALVPTLLDGLIWRSRTTENGQRRVNYYVKHLLVDEQGDFCKALEWIAENDDPKLVCHPVLAMVTDMIWGRVAFKTFMYGRAWFLFTLAVFVFSQSIVNQVAEDMDEAPTGLRVQIFVCRCFVYICSMGQWIVHHARNIVRDLRFKNTVKVGCLKIPEYLMEWQGWTSLLLTILLVTMLCLEPILHCMGDNQGRTFTEKCAAGDSVMFSYSLVSACATVLYFLLLSDLSVFSTRVSAFALVCTRVLSEMMLFLFGLAFFVAAFACAISALKQANGDFSNIPDAALNLTKMTFGMFSGSNYDRLRDEPALLVCIIVYIVTTVIFMLNMLIAQLNCSYQATYQDMLGYARLNRAKIVCETMTSVPRSRWDRFVEQLSLDECIEFGEGDIGLPGGVQVHEPASANITTKDMIRRFGGSTSPAAQWPNEELEGDEEDRFERMEKMMEKAMKRMTLPKSNGASASAGMGSGHGSSGGQSQSQSQHDSQI